MKTQEDWLVFAHFTLTDFEPAYSKLSIKRFVLLNDLFWIIIKRPGPSQKKLITVLFQGCNGQFLGSFKQPGLDI